MVIIGWGSMNAWTDNTSTGEGGVELPLQCNTCDFEEKIYIAFAAAVY